MVKIAVAGGSGQVAREVIDSLVAVKKHEITILSRKKASAADNMLGVTWRTVNYDDETGLAEALRGIHTVLSFTQLLTDPDSRAQKKLIDAAIIAGVNRFAPSEWGSSGLVDMPWWTGKSVIRDYLKKVNEHGKVLEYTLFQPGLFLEYLAVPYKTAKHLNPLNTMIDYEHRRAIVVDGHDATMNLTSVQDLAAVVVGAVDYDGEWPIIGGVCGNKVTVSQILKIGELIRGRPFTIDKVKIEDLENGKLTASWTLETRHPSLTVEQAATMFNTVLIGTLLSSTKGAWAGSDEFNQLLPDYKFTRIEDYLATVWGGEAIV